MAVQPRIIYGHEITKLDFFTLADVAYPPSPLGSITTSYCLDKKDPSKGKFIVNLQLENGSVNLRLIFSNDPYRNERRQPNDEEVRYVLQELRRTITEERGRLVERILGA